MFGIPRRLTGSAFGLGASIYILAPRRRSSRWQDDETCKNSGTPLSASVWTCFNSFERAMICPWEIGFPIAGLVKEGSEASLVLARSR